MAEKNKEKKAGLKHPNSAFLVIPLCALATVVGASLYKPEPPTPPICPGAKLSELKIGDAVVGEPLSMECSTGWMVVSPSSRFDFENDTGKGEMNFFFSNGKRIRLTGKDVDVKIDFPTRKFRIWGKGTPTYRVFPKSQ